MNRPSVAMILLLLAAFLTPLMGGQPAVDASPLAGSVLLAMLNPTDHPYLAHMAVALLIFAAGALVLLQRRVIQVANGRFMSALIAFLGLLVGTALFSKYQDLALAQSAEWFVYGLAAVTAVAVLGRTRGPVAAVVALFLAIVFLARNGIVEHFQMIKIDPTWRIFAGWQPNSLAGILLIGFFLGLGLIVSQRKLWAFLAGFGTIGILYALYLTQSRGAILVGAPLGLLFFALMALVGRFRPSLLVWVGRLAVVAIVVVNVGVVVRAKMPTLTGGSIVTESSVGSSSVLARVSGGAGVDQSVGFRKMLYVSSLKLLETDPLGSGLGSFRYVSAKPGLCTLTVLGHNTLLQLAVEASPFAPLFLLLLLWAWIDGCMKGYESIPRNINWLRLSIVSAVLATMFHAAVESNLYTFGLGLSMFLLLGVGLLLSADAVSAEITPSQSKFVCTTVLILALGRIGLNGAGEALQGRAKAALLAGDIESARSAVSTLQSLRGGDGDTWYLAATVAPSRQDRIDDLRRACADTPTPKNFRAYASALSEDGQIAAAISALDDALGLDPHNLPAMLYKLKLQVAQGDTQAAEATGDNMLATEHSLYFLIRSLPNMIPTETYEARLVLANLTEDQFRQARLLQDAVNGYAEYLRLTWPSVVASADGHLDQGMVGEPLSAAIEKMASAQKAAIRLASLYRALGKVKEAEDADGAAAGFGKALEAASSAK